MSTETPIVLTQKRQRRIFQRAKAAAKTDPLFALENIHRLLDAGLCTAEVLQLQATLLLHLGCGTFAARATEQAIQAGGDRSTLLRLLLNCYLSAYHRKPAAKVLESLLQIESLSTQAKAEVAHCAELLHQYDRAEFLYRELIEQNPKNDKYCTCLGYCYQKQGLMERAIECYQAAIVRKPESAQAYKLLSSVAKQTSTNNHLELIKAAMPLFKPDSEDFVTVSYALAKTYEDLAVYNKAFHHYRAGAEAMRSKSDYSTLRTKTVFGTIKSYFKTSQPPLVSIQSELKPETTPSQLPYPTPIFILGMPRTGSTLVDRMVSSHSQVVSMGELGCFEEAMKVVTGYGGGEGFHQHFYSQSERSIDFDKLGELYVNAASPEGFSGQYFIDKYPLNFRDLGLIAKALPKAKFIHTVRNPMDTCLSNYKQLFTLNFYSYSYCQKECAEYILLYQDLMTFWKQQLPGRILDVYYEEVVSDAKTQLERILEFLELKWDDACLNFHNNKNAG